MQSSDQTLQVLCHRHNQTWCARYEEKLVAMILQMSVDFKTE